MQKCKSKPLHGKYRNVMNQQCIDLEITNNWLKCINIFFETEGFVTAVQDGVIHTKTY